MNVVGGQYSNSVVQIAVGFTGHHGSSYREEIQQFTGRWLTSLDRDKINKTRQNKSIFDTFLQYIYVDFCFIFWLFFQFGGTKLFRFLSAPW